MARIGEVLRWSLGIRLGSLRRETPRPLSSPSIDHQDLCDAARLRFGIVTPVFNQVDYIAQTVQSVLGQRYSSLEYIVKDGGSNDGTVEKIGLPRGVLKAVLSHPDDGQASAINEGFQALGDVDVMAYLNGDDLLLPGAIACVARFLNQNPSVDVVYGHRVLIDERGMEVGRWVLPSHDNDILSWVDYIPQETLFWRRGIWEASGGRIDESFRYAMDWDLLVRFREAGATFARIPRFLGAFRLHEAQKTSKDFITTGRDEMIRIRRRTLGYSPTPWQVNRAALPYLLKHAAANRAYRWLGRL